MQAVSEEVLRQRLCSGSTAWGSLVTREERAQLGLQGFQLSNGLTNLGKSLVGDPQDYAPTVGPVDDAVQDAVRDQMIHEAGRGRGWHAQLGSQGTHRQIPLARRQFENPPAVHGQRAPGQQVSGLGVEVSGAIEERGQHGGGCCGSVLGHRPPPFASGFIRGFSMPDRDRTRIADPDVRRIALIVPQQGPSGIFGPSCEAAARLAVAEINADQGIRGAALEMVLVDGGAPPEAVVESLRDAMVEGVDAVTGWHISSVRQAVARVLAGRIPYVYPALYEGGESSDGVFCTGEVPLAQVRPAMAWLRDELGVRRWFIAGNDYLWPRLTAASTVRSAHEEGLSICGSAFVDMPSTPEQMSGLLDAVERSDCHGVLMLFPGQDGVLFNRQFAERELDRQVTRFSPLMEENMLMASGPEATRGLFAAAGYFRSLVSTSALDFQGRYARAFGAEAPALNTVAESTYSAVHVVAGLAELAGGMTVSQFASALEGAVLEVPRGRLTFAGRSAAQSVYLAQAKDYDFDIVTTL